MVELNWLPFDEFMQKIFNSTYHFQWHLYWLWSAQVSSVRAKLCSAFAQSGRRWWSRTWRECRGRPGLPSCRITLDNPECNCSFQRILGWGPSLSPLDFCNICNFSYILYDKWFWCSNFVLFKKCDYDKETLWQKSPAYKYLDAENKFLNLFGRRVKITPDVNPMYG